MLAYKAPVCQRTSEPPVGMCYPIAMHRQKCAVFVVFAPVLLVLSGCEAMEQSWEHADFTA